MQLEVQGLDEIHKALKKLGGREAVRARGNASRNAARVIAKRLKAAAPVRSEGGEKKRSDGSSSPGDLKRSVRVGRPFNGRTVSVAGVKMAYWGSILDTGRDSRRGVTFPQAHWIERTAMNSAQESINKFAADMWKQIANQWTKYAKRRGFKT
jgi:hypothetical protein